MDEVKTEEKKSSWKWSLMTKRKKTLLIIALVLVLWGAFGTLFRGTLFRSRMLGGMQARFMADKTQTYQDNTAVAVKDFESLGMVFVSVETKRGAAANNRIDVYTLLLKEAQSLGADGIINVYTSVQRKALFSRDITLNGSALAIKYTESIGAAAAGNIPALSMQSWFGHGRNWGRW